MTEKNLFELLDDANDAMQIGYDDDEEEEDMVRVPKGPVRLMNKDSGWAEGDGRLWVAPRTHKRLPGGMYRLELSPQVGPVFLRQRNDTDALVPLPDSESARIVDEIRQFRLLRPAFREHGFLYKRGFLLWGPPGSGKTVTLQMIAQLLMQEDDAVCVVVEHPGIAATALQALRRVEPARLIVALLEDLDALCQRYEESAYLSLLDGEAQVDNIVFVATSNYPEKLDRRFIDRPSRIDTVRYIGMPAPAARTAYLTRKLPHMSEKQIVDFVRASDGYSIAHLRELIILTQCFGFSLEASTARLNEQRFATPHSERPPGSPPFGFANAQTEAATTQAEGVGG